MIKNLNIDGKYGFYKMGGFTLHVTIPQKTLYFYVNKAII